MFPDFTLNGFIFSLYKGKGDRLSLDNDRGIFILSVVKMIIDKMNYNDCYDTIDSNMSDSQIGGRKNRNIRNHLFILYSIVNHVKHGGSKPIDITAYDVEKCFDSLWLRECINDLYEAGITDDRLVMTYESNKNNKVIICSPVGPTPEIEIDEAVMQGSSWGSILCSNQLGQIGGDKNKRNEYLYRYKNEVDIPSLEMCDDVLDISECGIKSVMSNAYINAKFELKRLLSNTQREEHTFLSRPQGAQ